MKTKIIALLLLGTLAATMALAVAPVKAYDCQVYVGAYDQYSQEVIAGVYIDGNYVGLSSNTYVVSAGSHSFGFEYFAEQYCFYIFSYLVGSPGTVDITSDTSVYAEYYTIIC
jgi:hypothetical protein